MHSAPFSIYTTTDNWQIEKTEQVYYTLFAEKSKDFIDVYSIFISQTVKILLQPPKIRFS